MKQYQKDFQKKQGVKWDFMNERTINQYLAWKMLQDDKHEMKPINSRNFFKNKKQSNGYSKKDMGVEMS